MAAAKDIRPVLGTMSMVGGFISLIGVIVGLYFQILPEANSVIRYAETGFFSICLPFLAREIWLRLSNVRFSKLGLEAFLVAAIIFLVSLLVLANQSGGILTFEFFTVICLTIIIVVLATVGAEAIREGINSVFRIRRINKSGTITS